MTRGSAVVLLGLACLGVGAAVPPQGLVDQGVFIIARDGNEIGREEFAIRPVAGSRGAGGLQAVAAVRYRDRELRAALELTREHVPVSYQLDVTSGGRLTQRLTGQFGRGRFSVRLVNASGEVAREFPVPPGAVVLDDDIFDQYYFVPLPHGPSDRISVVRPRQTTLASAQVRDLGPDTVAVAGHNLSAEHYAVVLPGEDGREFWFSRSGDLLKIALPGSGITATRLSLPSH